MQIYTGDRVGDYIMQGASQFGASVGGGLANMADAFAKAQEKHKATAQKGKVAASFFKASPDALKGTGHTPESFATLSPADQHSVMEGAMGAQAFAEGARAGEERTMRMLEIEKRMEREAEEAENARKAPDFYRRFGEAMKPRVTDQPAPGTEGPFNMAPGLGAFEAVGEASEGSGHIPDPRTLRELREMNEGAGGRDLTPFEQDISDTDSKLVGRGGSTFVVPKSPQEGTQRTEPDGTVSTWNGRTWTVTTRPPRTRRITDEYGETKIIEELTPEEAKAAREAGKKPAAAAPLPFPKSKAELKKGQTYQTSRGVATWDGEMFNLVK